MTADTQPDPIAQLVARDAIRDCLYRYARGIDRADEAALMSSYWPEAHDSHGATSGPIADFYDRVRAAWARGARNVHQISNILIDFRSGTEAAVESYFHALQRGAGPDGVVRQVQMAGRYCDLFECRDGEWRVIDRTVVYDWVDHQPVPEDSEADRFGPRTPIGGSFPDDPVYRIGRHGTDGPSPRGRGRPAMGGESRPSTGRYVSGGGNFGVPNP